jgi:hypothetical protein
MIRQKLPICHPDTAGYADFGVSQKFEFLKQIKGYSGTRLAYGLAQQHSLGLTPNQLLGHEPLCLPC